MGIRYLIDSNAVVAYLGNELPPEGSKFIDSLTPIISVITRIEILSSSKTTTDEMKKLQDFISNAIVFSLEENVILKTIEIRKLHRTKTPDAIIAATAIVNQLELITRNISDFKNIKGLRVINPFEI